MEKYFEGNNLIDLMSVAAFGPATEAKISKIDNQTNTDYLYVNEQPTKASAATSAKAEANKNFFIVVWFK